MNWWRGKKKHKLEERLMSIMDKMDEVVGDGPGEPRGKVPHMAKWMIEPSKPSEFHSDSEKGHAFLNSCLLYLGLCIEDFREDKACILWMLLFMKTGQTAIFAAWIFSQTTRTGKAYFKDWEHFEEDFFPAIPSPA
jgi:hypothetical protein